MTNTTMKGGMKMKGEQRGNGKDEDKGEKRTKEAQ